ENPGSVNVTEYMPGRRSTTRYWPDSLLVADRVRSMSAGLVASIVTPGSTAPLVSLTTPAMALCALALRGRTVKPRMTTTREMKRTPLDISCLHARYGGSITCEHHVARTW